MQQIPMDAQWMDNQELVPNAKSNITINIIINVKQRIK